MDSAEDIAWAAGLFEGEGCIYMATKSAGRPCMRLTSADEDVVLRFQRVVGCGAIHAKRPARQGWKPTWQWHLGKAADIIDVLNAFWPHLGERRLQKAAEAIERASKIGEEPSGTSLALRDWRARREREAGVY